MKRTAALLLGAFIGLAGAVSPAQSRLSTKDYDDFYSRVILEAKNGSKAEWLASYERGRRFHGPGEAGRRSAPRGQSARAREGRSRQRLLEGPGGSHPRRPGPFLGAKFKAADASLKAVLTPEGFKAYLGRYAQGAGGYRLSLEAVADRAALYNLEGKRIPRVSEIPAKLHRQRQRTELG
jgi:hypothetical protein